MLINTKLHIPDIRRTMIERKRLLDLMGAGERCALILVSGPAGSGKTSAVCQWVAKEKRLTAWYSIDEMDNDPDIFFRYFLTALANTEERLNTAIRPLLQNLKKMSTEDIIPTLVQALLPLENEIYLVLDDFHNITDQTIHDVLYRLVQYLPPQLHIVIVSRYSLEGLFPRLRIQGKTLDITGLDLAFTEEESKLFFSKVISVDLPENQIKMLTQYLEGWVTGYQLVGLSEKSRADSVNFEQILSSTAMGAIGYLIDEVIDQQPENLKRFLFLTVLLNRFDIALAQEITGTDNAAQIIDQLIQKNLFLVTLDSRQGWYRYHHLFLEAVKDRIGTKDPETCREVHRKAALWFAKNNYFEDAFQHAFATEDDKFRAELMEDYLLDLYNIGESAASLRWLRKLPEEILLNRPLLRLFECGFKLEAMDILGIEGVFQELDRKKHEAFKQYNREKKEFCEDFFLYLKCAYRITTDPGGEEDKELTDISKKIHPENSIFFASTKLLLGLNNLYRGRPKSAENDINEAADIIFSSENLRARIACRRCISMLAKNRGQLKKAETLLADGFKFLDQKGLMHIPLKLFLYLPMAEIYYERDDIKNALNYLLVSQKFSEQSEHYPDLLQCYYLLSNIYWSKGEFETAIEYRKKIETISKTIDIDYIKRLSQAHVCLLALKQGEPGLAQNWSRNRKFNSDEPFSLLYVIEGMAQAVLLLQQKAFKMTTGLLKDIRDQCVHHDQMEFVLYLDVFLTCSTLFEGDSNTARRFLNHAIAFSEVSGYIRPFVDAAPIILPLLMEIAGERKPFPESSHLSILINNLRGINVDNNFLMAGTMGKKGHDITSREIDILKMMAAGYKDREIAEKAFISLNTVKTHAKNIYKKLEVTGRMQAVAKARELEILKLEK